MDQDIELLTLISDLISSKDTSRKAIGSEVKRLTAALREQLAKAEAVVQAALKWRGQWPGEEDIREATEESCPCAICQLILACDALKGDS